MVNHIIKLGQSWRDFCRGHKYLKYFDREIQERLSVTLHYFLFLISMVRLRLSLKRGFYSAPAPRPVAYRPDNHKNDCPNSPGVYVRLDYWITAQSGGSYTHTCFVAKELNGKSPGLGCYMGAPYELLNEFELEQTKLSSRTSRCDDVSVIIQGQRFDYPLYEHLKNKRPTFIYERLALGNMAAARAARLLSIPYFVEYNGDMEVRQSYSETPSPYDDLLIAIENWAFSQATVISVVSREIKNLLINRGVPPERICVNPNGVDVETYAPSSAENKAALKQELGFAAEDVVLCFIGSFGGWHGIEVLAEALPLIGKRAPEAKFLIIGDGNLKYLVDQAVENYGLSGRVVLTGTVPQMEGRRLMGAADVFLCPHSGHMKNSKFLGSPTKLFEYLALGGGIVGTDLEQIGEILRPALLAKELVNSGSLEASDKRAILCSPGDVEEFVEAAVFLTKKHDIRKILGQNARLAAEREFTWEQHVERLWRFAAQVQKNLETEPETQDHDEGRQLLPAKTLAALSCAFSEKSAARAWKPKNNGTPTPAERLTGWKI